MAIRRRRFRYGDDYAVAAPGTEIEIAENRSSAHGSRTGGLRRRTKDHRGTFYFAQLATAAAKDSKGLVGFHGAGGTDP